MAIRLRSVNGDLVALCAARSIHKVGDVYLDDDQHHALAMKFRADFHEEEGKPHTRPITVLQEESNNANRDAWDKRFGTCSECKMPYGDQHRPSCHRQGIVSSESMEQEAPATMDQIQVRLKAKCVQMIRVALLRPLVCAILAQTKAATETDADLMWNEVVASLVADFRELETK